MDKKATANPACLRQSVRGQDLIRLHGDVPLRVLRLIYGHGFAPAFVATHTLRQVLPVLDRSSLDKLLNDARLGQLDGKIAQATQQSLQATG